jgi:hypothetical protein
MDQKETLLYASLKKFFKDPQHAERLKAILGPETTISLRVLDWLTTTYSKRNRLFFVAENGQLIDVHASYKSHLRSFSKTYFDIFRRGDEKITFDTECDFTCETTLAQLNFCRWLIKYDVLTYYENNLDKLGGDQHRKAPPGSKKKKKACHSSAVQSRLVFD